MKRLTLFAIALMGCSMLSAQTFTEWHDAEVNQINRAPMHSTFKIFDKAEAAAGKYCDAAYPYRLSLNGTWRFNWVENADHGSDLNHIPHILDLCFFCSLSSINFGELPSEQKNHKYNDR